MALDFQQLALVNSPGAEFPHRLESAHHGQIFAIQMAGLDRAAINKDRGDIQARDGHHRAGHVFVAAADGHQAIHLRRAANRFDRIRNHLARDQGILHPLRAHGDAVAHRDGAENLRHGSRFVQRMHGAFRQIIEPGVARSDGAVAVGYGDDRLIEIAVAEAHCAQHRAIGSPFEAFGNEPASSVESGRGISHGNLKLHRKSSGNH